MTQVLQGELGDLEPGRLEALVQDILAEAARQGASSAEAAINIEAGLSVTVRMGDVETVEHNRDKGLGVSVYFGHHKGSASTSDFSNDAVRETVRAACGIARHTAEDPCNGLADKARMASTLPELDLYHPWALQVDAAIELAARCEAAARGEDPRIVNSEGATVASHQGYRVYGNSHGFVGGYPSSQHSVSCSVIGQQDDAMQRDYWYTVARQSNDLEDAESVGRRAAQRTVRRLNARRLPTGRCPVLFASEVATGLLGHFITAIRGGSLYREASFLLDQMGKQVFPAHVHIQEQPHLQRAMGSTPFDNEGVATQQRDIVAGGVLQGYVLDSYSACKLGLETTGNAGGVHNLSIGSGELDRDALLRQMERGLLVTELMGQGTNIVTGDYSRGAAGFWVQGGEIQYPVEEITIAGNLRDMFGALVAVGTDVEKRGNIRTGSILLEEMTVAGE